jgi:hypothetical protein
LKKMLKSLSNTIGKSIVCGIVYLVSAVLAGVVLTRIGAKFPDIKIDQNLILWLMSCSGFLIAAIAGPAIQSTNLSRIKAFWLIFTVLFLNAVAQMIEGVYFAPGLISKDVALTLLGDQLIISLLMGLGITLLFRGEGTNPTPESKNYRPWYEWLWRFLLSAGSYVLFYYVFGSISFTLFTGEYYRSHMSGLHIPGPLEILAVEPIRAILLVASVLPLILNLTYSPKKKAIVIGMILFIISGLVPMLQTINIFPVALIIASTVEMFFQNFFTGVVAVWLLSCDAGEANHTSPLEGLMM